LEVPPEQAHQVLNESDASAEFVVVSQPPSHGDRKSEEAGRRHHV
jgi:mannose-6-phosphate isomerase-like protein (cupin superfamily)